ncbi:MAG: carbohydrate kinase family protein [Opitutaceae bacterium]|nr:carbohydrate kinase family protein [Opitutaceae bacterium]
MKISGLPRHRPAGVTTFLQSKAIDCSAFDYDDSFEGVRDMILVGGKTRTVFGRFGHYFGAATKRWSKPATTDIASADIVGLDPYFADESIEVARLSVELGKPYVTIDCPVESFLHRHSAATVVSAEYLRNQFPGRDPRQLLRDYADAGGGSHLTFGAEEILFARNGGAIQSVRPHLIVPKCTLGAGDTFRGGVMHAVFSGMADGDVVRFAAATAACVCLRFPMACDPRGLDEITAMAARIGR